MYSWYICIQKEFLSNLGSILLPWYTCIQGIFLLNLVLILHQVSIYINIHQVSIYINLTSGIYILSCNLCFSVCLSIWVFFYLSICLFVRLSDYNSGTPGRICLKFWLGNSGKPREWHWLSFEILNWVVGRLLSGKIAKIIIYDQVRVNYTTLTQPGFNPTLGILV